MEFNIYKCDFDSDIHLKKNDKKLSQNLLSRLNQIESEIINEFKKKQKGKVGIKTLGNEIRFNKIIQRQFEVIKNSEVLLKMTEHNRSFMYFFVTKLAEYFTENIYFLILSRKFGNSSQIVDKSFPDIDQIKLNIKELKKNFKSINKNRNVFFIEIQALNNHFFEKIEKRYVKIHKFKYE